MNILKSNMQEQDFSYIPTPNSGCVLPPHTCKGRVHVGRNISNISQCWNLWGWTPGTDAFYITAVASDIPLLLLREGTLKSSPLWGSLTGSGPLCSGARGALCSGPLSLLYITRSVGWTQRWPAKTKEPGKALTPTLNDIKWYLKATITQRLVQV